MAGVPVEALVEARMVEAPHYTISYAPSGTMFAWLQERRRAGKAPRRSPTESLRLLALGDPVFVRPDPSARRRRHRPTTGCWS